MPYVSGSYNPVVNAPSTESPRQTNGRHPTEGRMSEGAESALALQAAFADINIAKDRSVYSLVELNRFAVAVVM